VDQKPEIRTTTFRKIRCTDRSTMYCEYNITNSMDRDTRWRSAFRHCVKSRKVAGSIHDGVTRILHCLIPSRRTMALGSIQPLTEMNTRNYFLGLTTLPPSCADCQHPGNSREHPGLYMDWFNFNSMEHSPPGRENIC